MFITFVILYPSLFFVSMHKISFISLQNYDFQLIDFRKKVVVYFLFKILLADVVANVANLSTTDYFEMILI